MKVQIGEVYMDRVTNQKSIYPNKTRKYLLPCLKEYGTDFMFRLNNVFKIATGIGDIITDDCGFHHEKHIFILIDSSISTKFFIDFLKWIKDQSMYEDDYVFDNIQRSTYHMVVLKIPEKFYQTLDYFKQGKYSHMYDMETIEAYFEKLPDSKKVFIKDHDYKITFTERVNIRFGTTITPDEWHGELEFPPTAKTEIFNHHLKKVK